MFDRTRARELWESLPEAHRQDHFDSKNMPEDYARGIVRHAFGPDSAWGSQAVSFRDLPEPMVWELAWLLHHEVQRGHRIQPDRWSAMHAVLVRARSAGSPRARLAQSLTALTPEEWVLSSRPARSLSLDIAPGNREAGAVSLIKRLQDRLALAYHRGEWWRLDVWNPDLDPRIPRRAHEPNGRQRANFSHLTTPWLREAAKWWLFVGLTSERYVWTSVKSRLDHFKWLQRYINAVGCTGPQLTDDVGDLRPWVRGFIDSIRQHVVTVGPNEGGRLAKNGLRQPLVTLEIFYRFMVDHREEAARVLSEPRWLLLGPEHTVLVRPEDKPRLVNQASADRSLEDEVMTQIAHGCGVLGAPKHEGGLGDEQALRALMLLMRTGRRLNEVLMMDFDPLTPILPTLGSRPEGEGFVARLTYQQTKIESEQPASIPVDQEVVDIIHAQQAWVTDWLRRHGTPDGHRPPYLFIATQENRLGRRPYPQPTLHLRLNALNKLLNITDSLGRPVRISNTHRFRHTVATSLLNAGVPIHVVMRYLGHVTPEMTMGYAKTLASTAEREFLRYKKVTTDGRVLEMDGSDLFDLVNLDRRADRILPNGWCLLPPKQVCGKGNACLSCDKFATDVSHRPELSRQLEASERLVASRQAAFTERYGEPMPENNVWLAGRRAETSALRRVIVALDEVGVHDGGQLRSVRGAGAPDAVSAAGS